MNAWFSLLALLLLTAVPIIGIQSGLRTVFGVIIPYAALALFVIGFIAKVWSWAKAPVPFKIPTTCGQQKSLKWIRADNLESPYNSAGVIKRMILEILFFRSLFRNTDMALKEGPKLVYGSNKYLWLAGMLFHYSFLVILIRHIRFFTEPVPGFITAVESMDSFFQIGLPIIYITDVTLLLAVSYLFLRRVVNPQLRYISLTSDYFPLFLILAIGITGGLMRYIPAGRVDIVAVKELMMSLVTFNPHLPEGIGTMFYIHLFLVSVLIIYFPFSKLMHMPGVFLSPTRNMINDSRMRRHINPWNPSVKLHTYEEYEEEFRAVMREAGIPLEREE